MLKPKRKITRKEIKRDPFLETIDKIENSYEKNKKIFLNFLLALIAGIFIINFLIKKNDRKNIDSNTALGIAMVAFENKDYENAIFQFESIISDFKRTVAFSTANFYMGKIYFERNEYVKSESFLNTFLSSGDTEVIHLGAIKMLTHIALQNNEYDKAIKLLDSGLKNISKNDFINLRLMKAHILKDQGKNDKAKSLLEEIISEKKIPGHLKQKSEEFFGMM